MWGIPKNSNRLPLPPRFIPTRVGNTLSLSPWLVFVAVHPHACGEYVWLRAIGIIPIGSSPRVWGILLKRRSICTCLRFIPTRVGNTSSARRMASCVEVHPHACGEYFLRDTYVSECVGSSPRVWGIQANTTISGNVQRFIPTRVGNTTFQQQHNQDRAVHPHACGEYCNTSRMRGGENGSSPRVWGIPPRETRRATVRRFIPTRVGNTAPEDEKNGEAPVHPHACGEYLKFIAGMFLIVGSSPRVWGILSRAVPVSVCDRFIPTRVGNTHTIQYVAGYVTVHPHACGEYGHVDIIFTPRAGSSPRVWGIQHHTPRVFAIYRFIPTRVGNTTKTSTKKRICAVHPHACGEYSFCT